MVNHQKGRTDGSVATIQQVCNVFDIKLLLLFLFKTQTNGFRDNRT